MSHRIPPLAVALLVVLPGQLAGQATGAGRIWGRVVTAVGERIEGYLRWDRNETDWADQLDGMKAIPLEHDQEAERLDEDLRRLRQQERSISLVGLRITWDEDDGDLRVTAAGVRFGHVASLEVIDDWTARLVLISGQEVRLQDGASDIGRSFRGLVVEEARRGDIELRWRDLDRIDFASAPDGAPPPTAERLHGTVRTRMGVELTGYVAWDMDETLSSDVLDGEEGSRERDVVFETIATLERADARSTRVTLRSGEELLLSGTNDVNSSNRGVEVSDPSFGRAVVAWEVLESLRFHPPAAAADRRAFYDRAGPLTGIVETRAGRTHAGRIRWDNDEEFGWEMLDGRSDGVDYDIELGRVRIIEPVGSSQARVELRDGRSLLLEDSNDVDERNQGIFVLVEGAETVLVRWRDLARVTFTP
jgi:hypothetical protein